MLARVDPIRKKERLLNAKKALERMNEDTEASSDSQLFVESLPPCYFVKFQILDERYGQVMIIYFFYLEQKLYCDSQK